MQACDVIQAIAKKTGDIGASFYVVPETLERGSAQLAAFRTHGNRRPVQAVVRRPVSAVREPDRLVRACNISCTA
jgi:hypothetical protein